MNRNVDAGEIQHRRENRLQCDLAIGNTHVLGHQEGGRTHNGGHDLAAGGGGGFHRTCKLGFITGLLHHRDRDRACRDRIADRGAGHHAAESRRNNRNFCRSAGRRACDGICKADEEVRYSCSFEERTEDDEHHDILGADIDRRTHHARGGIEQVIDDLSETDIGKCIDQQDTNHAQDRNSDTSAAELHIGKDRHHRHYNHLRVTGDTGGKLDDGVGVQCTVKEGNRSDNQNHNIIPGDIVGANMLLADGIVQIPQNENQSEEEVQLLLRHHGAEERDPDTVDRECRAEIAYNLTGYPFPDSDIRLAVILLHHLFDILCGADFDLFRLSV